MHQRQNTIERVDPDEQKLAEIHKHPFGIIAIYIQTGFALVAALTLIFLVLPSAVEDQQQATLVGVLFAAISIFIAIGVLALTTYIYKQNRIIITDRNITQILQFGLFNRKVSQLNIVNVEDVTSVQSGVLPTMLNYGVLKIETAGEQSNFDFNYCPNSGYVAKVILDAREKMLGQMDEGGEALTDFKTAKSIKSKLKRRVGGSSQNGERKPVVGERGHIRIRGMGAEVVERAHELPDDD